jgi:hypothetical protein
MIRTGQTRQPGTDCIDRMQEADPAKHPSRPAAKASKYCAVHAEPFTPQIESGPLEQLKEQGTGTHYLYSGFARGALPREMRRAAALVFPQTLATRT